MERFHLISNIRIPRSSLLNGCFYLRFFGVAALRKRPTFHRSRLALSELSIESFMDLDIALPIACGDNGGRERERG